MKRNDSRIRIEEKVSKTSKRIGCEVAFAILFISIIYLEIICLMELPFIYYTGIFIIMIYTLAFRLIKRSKRHKLIFFSGFMLVEIAVPAILWKHFIYGFIIIINKMITNWNDKNGTIYYLYVNNSENITNDLLITLTWLMLLISLLINILVSLKKIEFIYILEIFIFVLCLFVSMQTIIPIAILLVTTFFGYVVLFDHCREKKGRWIYYAIQILEIGTVVFGCLLLFYSIPKQSLENLQENLFRWTEKTVYGNADLSDGDLMKIGARNLSNEVRLNLTSKEEDVIYLKGFVGGDYTGKQWRDLQTTIYEGNNRPMLQWMNEQKTPSQLLLTSYIMISNNYRMGTYETSEDCIKIQNVSAFRKYLYMPYTCMNISFLYYDNLDKDINLKNSILDQQNDYCFDIYQLGSAEFERMNNNGCLTDDKYIQAFETRFEAEQQYRNFVNDNYTNIPENLRIYFAERLASIDEQQGVNGAIEYIRSYLKEKTIYTDTPKQIRQGDFVETFLEDTKEGYSIHYASAATEMFRYYGIPARYVEGYRVCQKKGKTDITAENAHAWVEIYRYGMGWIPIEVTPGYYEKNEKNNYTTEQQIENPSPQVSQSEQLPQSEPENQKTNEKKSNANRNVMDMWKLCLMVSMLIVVILIISFLARRHIVKKKITKRLKQEDTCYGVLWMAEQMWTLARIRKIPIDDRMPEKSIERMDEEYREGVKLPFDKVDQILKRAKYSEYEITDDQYAVVKAYFDFMREDLKCHIGLIKKIWYEYVRIVL